MKPLSGYEPFAREPGPYLPCPAALCNKGLVQEVPQEPKQQRENMKPQEGKHETLIGKT